MDSSQPGDQPDPIAHGDQKNKKKVKVRLLKRHIELSVLQLLIIVLAFAAVGSYVTWKSLATEPLPNTSNSKADNALGIQAKRETMQLVGLAKRLQKNPGSQALIKQIQTLAYERKTIIQNLITQQPSLAIQIHFPSQLINSLPAAARSSIEQEVTLQGQLNIFHGEQIDSKNTLYNPVYAYYLTDSTGKQSQLYFAQDAGEQAEKLSRAKVKVTGVVLGSAVAVNSTTDVTVVSQTLAATTAATNKKLAVILFNFQDNPSNQPWTIDQVRTAVFGPADPNVSNYYKENSYGQIGLTGKLSSSGDVFGWYTINYSSTSACGLPPSDWSGAAVSAAKAAGVDLSNYDNFMYAWPKANCPFAGAAYLNGNEIWINGFATTPRIVTHELGHDFGVNHANSDTCTDSSGNPVFISANCTSQEYGDPYDPMGNSGIASPWHMNILHKGQLGYLSTANTQDVTTSGTYTIAPLEQPSGGVQTIRVLENPGSGGKSGTPAQYYYLDYRQPYGYDSTLDVRAVQGIMFHLGPDYSVKGNQTQLLDTTPGSTTYAGSFIDAALTVGKSIYDSANKITFTTKSLSSTGATVDIEFNSTAPLACIHSNPTITASPTSQWGNAGGALTYTATVVNNDSSNCAASTFSLASSLPAGLTQSPSSAQISLAPGAASTVSFTVTSSSTLAAGYYNITETATNSAATSYTNNAIISYNLYSAADATPPTVTITSPANGATLKKQIVISANATDNVAVSSIELYIDGNLRLTTSASSLSYTWNVNSKSVSRGTHTITVKAYDAAGNTGQSQITVTK